MGDKEKALQELESLRGQVSDQPLDIIVAEVKRVFDRGFGYPSVYIDVDREYPETEYSKILHLEYIITVVISFQGSADFTKFVKYRGRDEKVTEYHLKSDMIDWLSDAKQKYHDELQDELQAKRIVNKSSKKR